MTVTYSLHAHLFLRQKRTQFAAGIDMCECITYVYIYIHIWVIPKIRGTLLGVPIIRIIVYLGLHWGPLI